MGTAKSMIAAQLEVYITRFTFGACALIALRISVVPLIAGSKISLLFEIEAKKKGQAW